MMNSFGFVVYLILGIIESYNITKRERKTTMEVCCLLNSVTSEGKYCDHTRTFQNFIAEHRNRKPCNIAIGRLRPTTKNGFAQLGGHTPTNTNSWLTAHIFDIGHPCQNKVSADRGLKFKAHRGQGSVKGFLMLTADQVLVFNWIAGSSDVNL